MCVCLWDYWEWQDLHYGRDALAGIALFLSWLASSGKTCSALRKIYPDYYISKNRIELKKGVSVDKVFSQLIEKYAHQQINTDDGLKIDFEAGWVHMRKSNTEAIIRIYAESTDKKNADALAERFVQELLKAGC